MRLGLAVIAIMLPTAVSIGCAEHTVGGKSAPEVFPDRAVASLARAACEGETGRVAEAVRQGVNPNARGYEGAVPLLWAIHCNSSEGVKALLAAGADPNVSANGMRPIFAAASSPNPDILRLLLAHGGDPYTGYDDRRTPIVEAMTTGIHDGKWDNYYTLLNVVDVNKAERDLFTIGTFAARMAQFDKLAELLDRGYSRDLEGLAKDVQNRQVSRDREASKARVLRMLRDRGVGTAPTPPERQVR